MSDLQVSFDPSHVHDLSGFWPSIRVGDLTLPVYFLMTSVAFIAALLFLSRRADRLRIPRSQALDAALILMIAGFFGSRFFHVFFEEPTYYREDPMRVFDIWRGGFVWYGGALLGAALTTLYLRKRGASVARYLDLFAPVAALGYAVGRSACLFAGCCFGRITHIGDFTFRHPTQTYAIVLELLTLFAILRLERKRDSISWLRPSGQIFFLWLVLHGFGRLVMEAFRADPRGPEPLGLSISTWISIGLVFAATAVLRRRARAQR